MSTMIILSFVISPITRHSAVCVWMPLFTSITRIIRSMICAPPMIVRMSEAWPGQSTRVICIAPASSWPTSCSGSSVTNDENPRSSVIPRSLLCGCLSKHAVEPTVDSARERLVFPESTWPRMPTLMFSVFAGDGLSLSAIPGRSRAPSPEREGKHGTFELLVGTTAHA